MKKKVMGIFLFILVLNPLFMSSNNIQIFDNGISEDEIKNEKLNNVDGILSPQASANENSTINETFSGIGGNLDYILDASGSGAHTYTQNLTQQAPIEDVNSTTDFIILPENSFVEDLELNLLDLKYNNRTTQVINDSFAYTPIYTITYTAISNASDVNDQVNWVNISLQHDINAPVGDINITIYQNQTTTFTSQGNHNLSLTLTENNTIVEVLIEFYYEDNTLYTNQSIYLTRSNSTLFPHEDFVLSSAPSTPIYKYIHLNDAYENGNGVAFEFTPTSNLNLSTIDVFGRYNLYWEINTTYNLSISVLGKSGNFPNSFDNYGTIQFNGNAVGTQTVPRWITLDFSSQDIQLQNGTSYFIYFDAQYLDNQEDLIYFDLCKTYRDIDASQNTYSGGTLVWNSLNEAILYRISSDDYISASLDEIQVNATIYNSTLGDTMKAFDSSTSSVKFSIDTDIGGPWNSMGEQNFVAIVFSANKSCQFHFDYNINITQTLQSNRTNFIADFNKTYAQWSTSIDAELPVVSNGTTTFTNFNYTVQFPNTWYNVNGSAPTNNHTNSLASPLGPIISINSSVSDISWEFKAMSDYAPAIIETYPEDRKDFSLGMNVTCETSYDSDQYNARLSFWNVTFGGGSRIGFDITTAKYLNYSQNYSTPIFETNRTNIFPSYHIPETYTGLNITVKLEWHNDTTVGIQLKTFYIKLYSQLLNDTHVVILPPNNNITLNYKYLDYNNNSISDANVSTNWFSGDYFLNYSIITNNYTFNVHINESFVPGTTYYFNVNFSHANYITQTHSVKIMIIQGTNLALIENNCYESGDVNQYIYKNQTLELGYIWYTDSGDRISMEDEDDLRNITLIFDGMVVDLLDDEDGISIEYIYTETNSANVNLYVRINTRYLPEMDYTINPQIIEIFASENNETTYIEPQSDSVVFNIHEIPSYLSLQSSSSYDIREPQGPSANLYNNTLIEFENSDTPFTVTILYQQNNTNNLAGENINSITKFNHGDIYAYIKDKTFGFEQELTPRIQMDLLSDGEINLGIYSVSFGTIVPTLNVDHTYVIYIIANTTNFEQKSLSIELKIIPKWETIIILEDIKEAIENKQLIISGEILFNNGTNEWAGAYLNIEITIIYSDDVNAYIESFTIQTDENGEFYDSSITIPKASLYKNMKIIITIEDSHTFNAADADIFVTIEENLITRYVIPLIIIIIGLVVALFISKKYLAPKLKKSLPQTPIYNKFIKPLPIIGKKIEEYMHPSDANPKKLAFDITTIKTMQVPQIPKNLAPFEGIDEGSTRRIDIVKIEKNLIEEEVNKREGLIVEQFKKFNKKLKTLQDALLGETSTKKLIQYKNTYAYNANMLKLEEKYYDAMINFYFAKLYSERIYNRTKIDCKEEVKIYNKAIDKLLLKLHRKDKIKFLRKYD